MLEFMDIFFQKEIKVGLCAFDELKKEPFNQHSKILFTTQSRFITNFDENILLL